MVGAWSGVVAVWRCEDMCEVLWGAVTRGLACGEGRGSVLRGFVIGGGAVKYLGAKELVSVTQLIRDSGQLQVDVTKELVFIHIFCM